MARERGLVAGGAEKKEEDMLMLIVLLHALLSHGFFSVL